VGFKLKRKKKNKNGLSQEEMRNAVTDGILVADANRETQDEDKNMETEKLLRKRKYEALPLWKKRKVLKYMKEFKNGKK
jgi:hypothetical protein